jgi:hypothetical protein
MIRRVVRLLPAGRITEVVRQLAAEGALNDRFLESADGRVELLWPWRTN